MAERRKRLDLSGGIEDEELHESERIAAAQDETDAEPTEQEFYEQVYLQLDESDKALKSIKTSRRTIDAIFYASLAHAKLLKAQLNQQFIAIQNQEAMMETLEDILTELRKDRRR